ncbi:MAG TPA: diguanylate cyclase, partial [Pirellulales bacterium]|nr:diguanylate cyclase [Pirellulales bacterium]
MSNPARPLKIAVISPDTHLLHDVAWMLSAVGYAVETSRDVGETAAWRQFSDADILLFDGRSIHDPTIKTLARRLEQPNYRIFLYDPAGSTELAAWFAAGANDALRAPISRGELLARIRVGARVIEFENRMRRHSSRSRLPGMHSVRALLRKLSKFTTEGNSVTLGHTLLTLSIDFFDGLRREEGESAGRDLLAALAASIQQSVNSSAIATYAGDGLFHVVLPGQKLAAARVIAEQIAQRFRAAQISREAHSRLTVATAIIPWRIGVRPDQLLAQGLESLAIAKQSGGDCAMEQNAFEKEHTAWQNELAAGSPFANVMAQDIMEPFPAVLIRDADNRPTLEALERSGVPVWPFVDRDGRLVGVASPATETDDADVLSSQANADEALIEPVTVAHDAAFQEIYETFSTQG